MIRNFCFFFKKKEGKKKTKMETLEKQLYTACKNGNVEEVQQLLTNNLQINVNWQDNFGETTPFWIACLKRHIEVIKLLLKDKRVDVNQSNNDGQTPFYIACQNGQIEIVKLLLEDERVDINQGNSEFGNTPFWIACWQGQLETVKLLLNDKRIDINKADKNEATPLWSASFKGFTNIVEYILASGREVDLNAKNNKGKTAMEVSRENNKMDTVELLESFESHPNETRTKLKMQYNL